MINGYINGKFIDAKELVIPIEERGHQFGDGVYEVVRIYDGKPFMMKEHLDRLFASAEAIKLKLDFDEEGLTKIMWELIEKSGLTNLDLYIQITRGIATRNHLFPDCPVSVTMTVKKTETPKTVETGTSAMLYPDERWHNCYIKSLNLLPNILAKQSAFEKGYGEAILVKDGKVTEGTNTTVFIVKDLAIITTPLSKQILSGITRIAVKNMAEQLDIPFIEKDYTPDELLQADEVFITSTTQEVTPIIQVEDTEINGGKIGQIVRKLQERFNQLT